MRLQDGLGSRRAHHRVPPAFAETPSRLRRSRIFLVVTCCLDEGRLLLRRRPRRVAEHPFARRAYRGQGWAVPKMLHSACVVSPTSDRAVERE